MNKKLPKFKSEEEAAQFWSKHTPLDYPDEFKNIKNPFKFSLKLLREAAKEHREKKKSLTFRMEQSQILLAKIIANSQNAHYQSLMRMWIRDRIRKEIQDDPEIERYIRKQHLHLLKS